MEEKQCVCVWGGMAQTKEGALKKSMVVGFKCKYTKQSREEDCGEKLCDLSSSSPLSFLFQTEILLSSSQGVRLTRALVSSDLNLSLRYQLCGRMHVS